MIQDHSSSKQSDTALNQGLIYLLGALTNPAEQGLDKSGRTIYWIDGQKKTDIKTYGWTDNRHGKIDRQVI